MNKKFRDLHKLRLLNFDSGDTKENKVFEGEIRKPGYFHNHSFMKNIKYSTNGFIGKCSKWVNNKSSSETCFKERSSRKTRMNNIFKRQSSSSKRAINKRSVSLYNLKHNFSASSFLTTNPIKNSLKTVTEPSLKQKRNNHYNNKDVQVLFMSETRRPKSKLMKPNISEDKRKLDKINNSKSSKLDSSKSNKYHSNKNYQSPKNNHNVLGHYNDYKYGSKHKQYKNSTDPVKISNLKLKGNGSAMPMRYNLIDFSCTACKVETPFNDCLHKISTVDTSPCLNKYVWVRASSQNTGKNAFEYSGKVLTPNLKINETSRIKNINEVERCELFKPNLFKGRKIVPFSSTLTNPETLAKATLKYFLIVIAIIVWSPCILLMCLYWFVTYPARPINFFKKSKRPQNNIFGFPNKLKISSCRRNCCKHIFNLFTKISEKVNNCYSKLFSIVKKQKSETCIFKPANKKSCMNTNQNPSPNPKNKYTLYYNPKRGWIIKPLTICRRPINKSCECNFDDFPSLVNNSKKKIMCDQSCECFPKKLKNTIKCKNIQSLCRQPYPGIVFKKSSSVPLPDLISNGACCHASPINCQMNRKRQQRNVSFEANELEPLDTLDPCNSQIMSPRLDTESTFTTNTLPEKCVRFDQFEKNIKGRSPCLCQGIKKISVQFDQFEKKLKRMHPCLCQRIKKVSTKPIRTNICKTPCRLRIRPKLSCYIKSCKEEKLAKRNKLSGFFKSTSKNVNDVVHDVECEVWKCGPCNDVYIHTLRRKPCFWIYKRCPGLYPYFVVFYRFYENAVVGLLFIISTCIWVPILCWCYICFSFFCRCCKC